MLLLCLGFEATEDGKRWGFEGEDVSFLKEYEFYYNKKLPSKNDSDEWDKSSNPCSYIFNGKEEDDNA